jgi:hypothetical protein
MRITSQLIGNRGLMIELITAFLLMVPAFANAYVPALPDSSDYTNSTLGRDLGVSVWTVLGAVAVMAVLGIVVLKFVNWDERRLDKKDEESKPTDARK